MALHAQNFINPVTFGVGALARIGKTATGRGISRALICTDRGVVAAGLLDRLTTAIGDSLTYGVFAETPPNPTERAVELAADLYRAQGCDGLIGLGGGSAIDLAKAVGVRVTHDGPLVEYSQSVPKPQRIGAIPPLIAIPTTAGTGAESSMGCPLMTHDGKKSVLASSRLVPAAALCDPELTLGLPANITAATGMDAVTHCIEGLLSAVVHPPADAVALDGIARAIGQGWLERAVTDGANLEARWHMMMAAQEGAMAFVKPLGAAHAMSHACSRLPGLNLNHGLLNAICLPEVLRFNAGIAPDKEARIRHAMGLSQEADIAAAISALNARIGIPAGLASLGVTAAHKEELVDYSLRDLCHGGNLRPVTASDYTVMFERLLAA